jgi:GNAT superfamily N-acetyltransferase
MLVRPMEERDVRAVVELARAAYDGVLAEHHSDEVLASFRAEVTPESFREQLATKQFFVAEAGGDVVAVGALADFGARGEPRYSVSQFYVRADRHRRGIGKRLLARIVRVAREAGVKQLHVPSSRNAVAFYEDSGFTVDIEQPDRDDEITWMTRLL